eukprot:5044250-Alexandrium_andersonii.AAC.1
MLASSLVIGESNDEGAARPGNAIWGSLHTPTAHQEIPASQRAPPSLANPAVVGGKAEGMSQPFGALREQQDMQNMVQTKRHPHVRVHIVAKFGEA